MAYLGRPGATAPLTSADIPDNSITGAKIVAGTIEASDVAADMATQAELDTVSTVASAALPKAGGTMTGNIVMGDDTSIGISDSDERIEFDGAGDISVLGANLGIGTDAPDATVHLKSSATNLPVFKLENTYESGGGTPTVTGNAPIIELFAKDTGTGQPDSQELGILEFRGSNKDNGSEELYARIVGTNGDANSNGELKFETQQSNSMATAMTVRSGNVGIQQSSPSFHGQGGLHIGNSSSSNISLILEDNNRKWEIHNDGQFQIMIGSDTKFRIHWTSYDTYTNDGTVSSLSDSRIKENIENLADGLDIINQLQPRTFEYNGKGEMGGHDGTRRYGFIADEVLEVAPHYVGIDKGKIDGVEVEDFKTMSTTRLIPMMVNAIQELSAKNDALEAENTALKTRMDALEARVTALEG